MGTELRAEDVIASMQADAARLGGLAHGAMRRRDAAEVKVLLDTARSLAKLALKLEKSRKTVSA